MNAKRLIVTSVFAIILIGFFIWIISVALDDTVRKNRIWKEQAQQVTEATEYINSLKLDVMYYGVEIELPSTLHARKIPNFENSTLADCVDYPDHVGHMIIINDPSGDLPMTEEQWKDIFRLMKYEGYIIIYLGQSQLKAMQQYGFFFDVYSKDTRSAIFWNNGTGWKIGFADDPELVPEVVREQASSEQLPLLAALIKINNERYF